MFPIDSAVFITRNSENVKINELKLKNLCDSILFEINNNKCPLLNWALHKLHPKSKDLNSIAWIFFIDTLNFSFWPDEGNPKYTVEYEGEQFTGYWSICAALNKTLDNGMNITDASEMALMTIDKFESLFGSINDGGIPLLQERVKSLNEAGKILIEKFGGHFINCIKLADKSCLKLLEIIVENFSSYRDECSYKDQKVSLYKRAQILIADIWCCFEGQGWGEFYDIDSLTAFADYRVPQVLAYFGVIEYSDELRTILDQKQLIENGDSKEVEIRGVTLYAIQLMTKYMKCKLIDNKISINSILLDNYLWDYRRKHAADLDSMPMHRTRTIFY